MFKLTNDRLPLSDHMFVDVVPLAPQNFDVDYNSY